MFTASRSCPAFAQVWIMSKEAAQKRRPVAPRTWTERIWSFQCWPLPSFMQQSPMQLCSFTVNFSIHPAWSTSSWIVCPQAWREQFLDKWKYSKWTWQNEISLAQRVTFYRTQSRSMRQAKRLAWDVRIANFSQPGQVWKPIWMTIMARHTTGHWPILAQELTAEFRPPNKIHVSLAGWACEVASLLSHLHHTSFAFHILPRIYSLHKLARALK